MSERNSWTLGGWTFGAVVAAILLAFVVGWEARKMMALSDHLPIIVQSTNTVTTNDVYIFDIKITGRAGEKSDSFLIGYRGGYPKDPFVGSGDDLRHPWIDWKGNEIIARITTATNMFWEVGRVSKTNFYGQNR